MIKFHPIIKEIGISHKYYLYDNSWSFWHGINQIYAISPQNFYRNAEDYLAWYIQNKKI